MRLRRDLQTNNGELNDTVVNEKRERFDVDGSASEEARKLHTTPKDSDPLVDAVRATTDAQENNLYSGMPQHEIEMPVQLPLCVYPLHYDRRCVLKPLSDFSLGDVEAVRLLLHGGSIIDWHRLNFSTVEEVNEFLAVNLLDIDDPTDRARLDYLFRTALGYLSDMFGYRFPQKIEKPKQIQDIFLYASNFKKDRLQVLSCAILKVMHTLQHSEAREILFNARVSTQEIASAAEARVSALMNKVIKETNCIVDFYGGQKTKNSIVTKLLSKKENVASSIFDRVRFRIITKKRSDILPLLNYMLDHLLPFNYIVPLESHNSLIPFHHFLERNRYLSKYRASLQLDIDIEEEESAIRRMNIFSGKTYRTINFVSDLPLRIDIIVPNIDPDLIRRFGRIIFATVEYQVVDLRTHENNEKGENSHERYKSRQLAMVQDRLRRGLLRKKFPNDKNNG